MLSFTIIDSNCLLILFNELFSESLHIAHITLYPGDAMVHKEVPSVTESRSLRSSLGNLAK